MVQIIFVAIPYSAVSLLKHVLLSRLEMITLISAVTDPPLPSVNICGYVFSKKRLGKTFLT